MVHLLHREHVAPGQGAPVSGLIGGDVDQLHQLGDQLKLKQGDIDQIIGAVRTALGNTVWQGRPATGSRASGARRSSRR